MTAPAPRPLRLLLASASPRRRDLLSAAGIACDVAPADVDETPAADEAPAVYVARLAGAKARSVARRHSGRVVVGADTAVVLDRRILGKPADAGEAAEMLRTLSGRTHEVLTGVAVWRDAAGAAAVETTSVRFLPLTIAEIAWYIRTGEPAGKAGAYAIQGGASRFVDRLEGSYSNVVGLPVATVCRLLREIGVDPLHLEGVGGCGSPAAGDWLTPGPGEDILP